MTAEQGHSFDWPGAIRHNRDALLRIVAALFAMAGLTENVILGPDPGTATLPRHLRNRLLRILRPAESAARRLIVIAARGMEVAAPTLSPRGRESDFDGLAPRSGAKRQKSQVRGTGPISLPILDTLPALPLHPRRRYAKSFPRICVIGLSEPTPIPDGWYPAPDDAVDATRLCRRLAALKRALDDLDGNARRLARWRAKGDLPPSPGLTRGPNRSPRFSPLRPGRPPGHRKRPVHEIDAVLRECHGLAWTVWNDTS